MELKDAWFNLGKQLGADESLIENSWSEILGHYSHKSRAYHNLDHIKAMLQGLEKFQSELDDEEILRVSIWLHDIIYKAGRNDNEKKSAEYARKFLSSTAIDHERVERCYRQIISTKTHQLTDHSYYLDEALLLDLDLEVLSRAWDEYELYTRQIRREYKMFPWILYKKGRIKVLRYFLGKTQIYQTEIFQKSEEKKARSNILRELAQLLED